MLGRQAGAVTNVVFPVSSFFHSCRTKIVIELPIVHYGYLDLYVHEQFGMTA